MCLNNSKPVYTKPRTPLAAYDNQDALKQGNLEARLRRLKAGAAANILTSAVGIPATATLGGIAK